MYSRSLHDGYNQKRVGVKTKKCQHMHQGTTLHTDDNTLAYPACFCVLFFEMCVPGRVIQVKTQEVETTTRESHIEASCALKSSISRTWRDTWSDMHTDRISKVFLVTSCVLTGVRNQHTSVSPPAPE